MNTKFLEGSDYSMQIRNMKAKGVTFLTPSRNGIICYMIPAEDAFSTVQSESDSAKTDNDDDSNIEHIQRHENLMRLSRM